MIEKAPHLLQIGASHDRKLDKGILSQMLSQHQEYSFHQQPDTAPWRTSSNAIASHNFDAEVLAGFRRGYSEHAVSTAEKTLAAGASATVTILQMAGWIQEMKSRLNRKEFGTFVKGLLQWVGGEARKYLDIARAFENLDLKRLVNLEPFTILKLRSKRYAPVVAKLREQPVKPQSGNS